MDYDGLYRGRSEMRFIVGGFVAGEIQGTGLFETEEFE